MAWLSVLSFFHLGCIAQIILTVACAFLLHKCAKFMLGTATRERLLKAGTVGRFVGRFEENIDLLSVEKGGAANLCLTISLTSKQSLSHQHVRDALVRLVKRQPMLRARITTENGGRYFEIKEINEVISMLDITFSDVKTSDWKDVWFEYTAKQFGNGLLWRVVILQEKFASVTKDYANTLMFSFNHSFIDGVSCVKFCKQFLKNMNELANGATVDQEIPSLNMLPYFHDIVTLTRPWHLLFNFILTYCGFGPIFRFFAKRSMLRQFQTIKCNPYFAQFPPRLDVLSFTEPACRLSAKVFTENETKNILQACKANNCTVTGALAAAANLAFCELIKDSMKGNEVAKIKWDFAIDAKRRFEPKPQEEYLGFFVYMCYEPCMNHVIGSDVDFWKVARETTKEIRDGVKAERYITAETMLCHTMKPKEFFDLFDRELSIRSSACNSFSSFGSFGFSDDVQHQYYKLHEIFVNCLTHNMPHTFVHFNHTVNDKMYWQITHDESRIETRHAEEFASLCFGRFIEIARGRV